MSTQIITPKRMLAKMMLTPRYLPRSPKISWQMKLTKETRNKESCNKKKQNDQKKHSASHNSLLALMEGKNIINRTIYLIVI